MCSLTAASVFTYTGNAEGLMGCRKCAEANGDVADRAKERCWDGVFIWV